MLKLIPVGELKDHFPKQYKTGYVCHTSSITVGLSGLEQLIDVKQHLENKVRFMVGPSLKTARALSPYEVTRLEFGKPDTITKIWMVPTLQGDEMTMMTWLAINAILMLVGVGLSLALRSKQKTDTDSLKSVLFRGSHVTSVVGSPIPYAAGKRVMIEKAQLIEASVKSLRNAGSASAYVSDGTLPPPTSGGGVGGSTDVQPWKEWAGSYDEITRPELFGELNGAGGGGAKQIQNQNNSYARISGLLVTSGGETDGPYGATPQIKEQNMFFNETYFRDPGSNTYNMQGIRWTYRKGVPNQPLVGITPGISDFQSDGVEKITKALTNGLIKQVRDVDADFVDAIIRCRLLQTKASDGDQKPTEVRLQVFAKRNSSPVWEPRTPFYQFTKNTEGFDTDHTIPAPAKTSIPDDGWQFKIVRETPDSTDDRRINDTELVGWNEVLNKDLTYDGSTNGVPVSLIGLEINSANYGEGEFPPFAMYSSGKKVRVPSNYNTATRTYTGVWDLSWKWEDTDDPVWLSYDMATSKLGGNLPDRKFNPAQLLAASKWCSEKVNGRPRYTLNKQYWESRPLWEHLQEVAKTFRGRWYYNGRHYHLLVEMAGQPVRHFINNDKIEGGLFDWTETAPEDRFNEARTSYMNLAKFSRESVTVVRDQDNIDAMKVNNVANGGVVSVQLDKEGCDNEDEARYWAHQFILSSLYETDVCSFTTGISGEYFQPGERIQVFDYVRNGETPVGRVKRVDSNNTFRLDVPYTFKKNRSYQIKAMVGLTMKEFTLPPAASDVTTDLVTITGHGLVAETPLMIVDSQGVKPWEGRIVSVQSEGPGKYSVVCQQWREDKFTLSAGLPPAPPNNWPVISGKIGAPTHFRGKEWATPDEIRGAISRIELNWNAPTVGAVSSYSLAHWPPSATTWTVLPPVKTTFHDLEVLEPGKHAFKLQAVNMFGDTSDEVLTAVEVGSEITDDGYAPIFKRVY